MPVAVTVLCFCLLVAVYVWVVIKTGADAVECVLVGLITTVIGGLLLILVFVGTAKMTSGFMSNYAEGERTGYITKISRKGLFWQTNESQLQVGVGELASLQEPFSFSVPNRDVLEIVNDLAGNSQKVKITYKQWAVQPLWRGRSGYEATRVTAIE